MQIDLIECHRVRDVRPLDRDVHAGPGASIDLHADKLDAVMKHVQAEAGQAALLSRRGQHRFGRGRRYPLLGLSWPCVLSWSLIILYLWIRFQGVAFGLAAVIALIHDVLVMLGAIAFSYYLAPVPGLSAVTMIEPFKINLPIVAAFLTIIGYSVNDTIVVFDRIREIRGKSPTPHAADGQRRHQPDPQPHGADDVHGVAGGGRSSTSSAARRSTASPSP